MGLLVVHIQLLLKLVIFMTKQNLQGKSSKKLLFSAKKYCMRQCTLLPHVEFGDSNPEACWLYGTNITV